MIVLSQELQPIEISSPTAVATGPTTATIGITVSGTGLSHPVFGWHNVVEVGAVSATSEDDEHPVDNLANPSTFLRWQATSAGAQTLTIQSGDDETIDYVGIVGHNLGTAGITASLTGLGVVASPDDDSPLILRFLPQAPTSINLVLSTGSEPARIGCLYVGQLLVMERSFTIDGPYTPFPRHRLGSAVAGVSQGGNFLGRIVLDERREATVEFDYLTRDWYEQHFDPFLAAAVERPFFFASDPIGRPREVGFAWFDMSSDKLPRPDVDPVTGTISIRLEMMGLAR